MIIYGTAGLITSVGEQGDIIVMNKWLSLFRRESDQLVIYMEESIERITVADMVTKNKGRDTGPF